jgi:hypothetical protein
MGEYNYSTPYGGIRVAPLPEGFMAAATAPGRNYGEAVRDVGSTVDKWARRNKQGKSLDSLAKSYLPKDSPELDRWGTLSVEEKEGALRGYIMKQEDARKAKQDQVLDEQLKRYKRETEQQDAFAKFLGSAQVPADTRMVPGQAQQAITPGDLQSRLEAYYSGESGEMPNVSPEMLQQYTAYRQAVARHNMPVEIPQKPVVPQMPPRGTNRDFFVPNGGSIPLTNPAVQPPNVMPIQGAMPATKEEWAAGAVTPSEPPTAPELSETVQTMQEQAVPQQEQIQQIIKQAVAAGITDPKLLESAIAMTLRGNPPISFHKAPNDQYIAIGPKGDVTVLKGGSAGGDTPLHESEVKSMKAIQQSRGDVANLRAQLKDLGASGPLAGFIRQNNPWDWSRKKFEAAIVAALPNLARGVFGEVGVLTDADMERYKKVMPTLKDSKAQAEYLINDLERRLNDMEATNLDVFRRAGRDVSGFEGGRQPGTSGASPAGAFDFVIGPGGKPVLQK